MTNYQALKYSTRIYFHDKSVETEKIKVRILNEKYLKSFCRLLDLDIEKINPEGYERPNKDLINTDWSDMPEYRVCSDKWFLLELNILTKKQFTEKTNLKLSRGSCWYPHRYRSGKEYCELREGKEGKQEELQNSCPLYVLSLGRYKYNDTYKSLKSMGCKNIKVFVEPFEYKLYLKVIPANELVKLPKDYHLLKEGGKHVRNFIHIYSKLYNRDKEKYWLLDDNIDGFYFFQDNIKYECLTGFCFYYVEKFMNKWKNSYLGGMGYSSDICEIEKSKPCIVKNSKVYSCFLINNDITNVIEGELWKGKYNEDIILCIELLKKGYPTFTTNMFLCNKLSTGNRKGGNQVNLYKDTKEKSWDYIKTDYLLKFFPLLSGEDTIRFSDRRGKKYHHYINWNNINKNLELIRK